MATGRTTRAPKRSTTTDIVPLERITRSILLYRGQKVMLDADLAVLYGVPTKVLVQAVKRNFERFPEDFMFQLTNKEFAILRSQTVTSRSWGGRRTAPYAFTEQGVAMLSSVLSSDRAVKINIAIMRAFVQLRTMLASHTELATKLDALEKKYDARRLVEKRRQAIELGFPAGRELHEDRTEMVTKPGRTGARPARTGL